jgi:dihydrofolate reductase
MRTLSVFEMVSLDGYFTDANSDMSWAHKNDPEWNQFVAGNAQGEGELLFGRRTYEMMASWWPTPQAMQSMPAVAEGMNSLPKVVFSKTLDTVSWSNTTLVKDELIGAVRRMKQQAGGPLVILGSGSIVSQLAQAGLIDEFQIALNPIVLGKGRTIFETVDRRLALKLISSRAFANGNLFMRYEPAA